MHASLVLAALLILPADPPAVSVGKQTEALQPDPSWGSLGRSLWLDPKAKRVILQARVVLREGMLEHLMCLKGTKEHEAILATDAVARQIHAALLAIGAEPCHPVRFLPKFEPPKGSAIGIELTWWQDGKLKRSDAREWVRDERAKAPLAIDWVFAGSELYDDPLTKKTLYAADDGDVITVANFGSAILDLPIASSASDADRVFVTNTEKIPPLGTEVFVSLSLRPLKSKEKPAAETKPRQ
jgi:hypothetical protein